MCYNAESFCTLYEVESLCRCYRWSNCAGVIGGVIVQVL